MTAPPSGPLPSNPLLADADWPRFDQIDPALVTPALDSLLGAAEQALAAAGAASVAADYDALAQVLDEPVERLQRAWSLVGHLQAVADTPALRAAYADNLPRITDFHTRLAADERLFAKTRAIADGPGFAALSPARRKVVTDALLDFELGGAALPPPQRARFAQVRARMAALSQQFGEHLLDATDAWTLRVPEERLAGTPDDLRQSTRAAAAAAGLDGHLITLHAPCRLALLSTAEDRELRRTVFEAHAGLASELGPAAWNNGPLMAELLQLRDEEARLLGRASFAEVSLADKMAQSPAQVQDFLRDLAGRARPFAERELDELRRHGREALGLDDLQPWDRSFVAEKLKQALHGVDDEALRPYFTEPQVLSGLFELVHTLFDIQVEAEPAALWHADARAYRLTRHGQTLGRFTLDLYARPGKESGAWMDEAQARWRRPHGTLQLPQAHLVCNFAPPSGARPALLRHDDVVTLFHEFGHGLHHLLTQVDERAVAGIAGVEWDAAEMPSQFMENFAWQWPVLQRLTSHVDTGEPLPRALFDRMLAARHFGSGLRMLRGVEFALFDMRVHGEPGSAGHIVDMARAVTAEVALVARPPFDRYPHSFSHLFDGGYAAGYYGYSWAEVLSADAFGAFEDAGVLDAATGRRWCEAVLETGGSRPALDSFVAFRGRPPRIDALLRHQGLV